MTEETDDLAACIAAITACVATITACVVADNAYNEAEAAFDEEVFGDWVADAESEAEV